MTDNTPVRPGPDGTVQQLTEAERLRGAMLGGAVGDALGAPVRKKSLHEIQQRHGVDGVDDYVPAFGRAGGVTELSQITVFTLDALLRAKAVNATSWLPTHQVFANHLRWLYTQGVPWEHAMSGYLQAEPKPNGWLLERPELYSTRNPGGPALAAIGWMAEAPPFDVNGTPNPSNLLPGLAECTVWAAPAMLWGDSSVQAYAAAAGVSHLISGDGNVHAATGMHADVLAQVMLGGTFSEAVAASEAYRLGSAYPTPGPLSLNDVRRAVHTARFFAERDRRPEPAELDVGFDCDQKPGELGIALAAVLCSDDFTDAVLMAVNHSADSCVTGALAGQLAGAVYGVDAIPAHWLEQLELGEIIEVLCADAAEAFAPPMPEWAQRYLPYTAPDSSVPAQGADAQHVIGRSTVRSTGTEATVASTEPELRNTPEKSHDLPESEPYTLPERDAENRAERSEPVIEGSGPVADEDEDEDEPFDEDDEATTEEEELEDEDEDDDADAKRDEPADIVEDLIKPMSMRGTSRLGRDEGP